MYILHKSHTVRLMLPLVCPRNPFIRQVKDKLHRNLNTRKSELSTSKFIRKDTLEERMSLNFLTVR